MGRQDNCFALLDDEDGDDVSKLIERVVAKVEASLKLGLDEKKVEEQHGKNQKSQATSSEPKLPSRRTGYVRSERGGGHVRGSARSRGNDVEQLGNGQPSGYRWNNNGGANGYQKNNGGADGFQRRNRRADGYRSNNGGANAYQKSNEGTDGYQRINRRVDGHERSNDGADGYRMKNGVVDGYPRTNGGYRRINGRSDGYKQNNGEVDGYGRNNGRVDRYRRNNGGADGFIPNYGSSDSYQQNSGGDFTTAFDGNWQGQGHGRGRGGGRGRGRGRGRGLNGDHGFRNESQVVEGNQYLENHRQDGVSGAGWERVTVSHSFRDEKQHRNGNRNYGGERKGNGGGKIGFRNREGRFFSERDFRNSGRGEMIYNSETKKAHGASTGPSGGRQITGEDSSGGAEKDILGITEVSNAAERKQGKVDQVIAHDKLKNTAQEKKITLEEYEKLLIEKRKALEALKTEERKVILDKDFEAMQLVEKKKEDSHFVTLISEMDKLTRNESHDKDEKIRKVKSQQLLLGKMHIRGSRRGQRRGYIEEMGQEDGGGYIEDIPRQQAAVPVIEDSGQFPDLGKAVKA